jgi:hypothetical protein
MTSSTLKQAVAGLVLLGLPALGWAGQAAQAPSPFKGEYFVTRNQDPVCVPYTRNLNQFRRLDFDVCNPRLSDKFPRFSRPPWEEIPFDLALVELIIKNIYSRPENAVYWDEWLKVSEPFRAEGKIKLWRTQVDIDNDGKPETILRLEHPLTPKEYQDGKGWKVDQSACVYRNSMLYMLGSPNEMLKNAFNDNVSALGDIIHFPFPEGRTQPGGRNGYYGFASRISPAETDGVGIGATRGMKVYVLFHLGAGDVCWINWVPTGRYRPLKRTHATR